MKKILNVTVNAFIIIALAIIVGSIMKQTMNNRDLEKQRTVNVETSDSKREDRRGEKEDSENKFVRSQYSEDFITSFIITDDYYIAETDGLLVVTASDTENTEIISEHAGFSFVSDGHYLYYVENNEKVYRVNLSDFSKEVIFSKKSVYVRDCKDNKYLLFEHNPENSMDPTESTVSIYDMENDKTYEIARWVIGIGFCDDRVIYVDQTQEYSAVKMYSSDIYGDDIKEITDNAVYGDIHVEDNYIYYAEFLEDSAMFPPFIVKRCDKNGLHEKELTDVISGGYLVNLSSEYVEHGELYDIQRVYFKEQ